MRLEDKNPIPALPLLQNFWVFLAYGVVLGLGIGVMSDFKFDLEEAEELMIEPLSYYSFSALSIVGMLGLMVSNLFFAKSAEGMRSSWIVCKIFAPISNAGLSSGAIITGMMVGLALGLLPWRKDEEVWGLVKALSGMSVVIVALLFPMFILKRSMFDLSTEAERKFTMLSAVYGAIMGLVFWYVNKEKFLVFLGTIVAASLAVVILAWLIRDSAQKRSSKKYREGFK